MPTINDLTSRIQKLENFSEPKVITDAITTIILAQKQI